MAKRCLFTLIFVLLIYCTAIMSALSELKAAQYKRLIVCCDGTWLAPNTGDDSQPSNVAKIARAISPNGRDAEGNIVKQIVSYHAGLGSGDLPGQRAIYGGFGWGLDHDVTAIYDFIANNYELGDELFFFGFSRGAFTVRSAAGLVSNVGVLSAVNMSKFSEMWAAYRARNDNEPFKKSAWYQENKDKFNLKEVQVKVVGVWDTVGALGVPRWPVVSWLQKFGLGINRQYEFHDTAASRNIDYAFHALSIDEKRLTFPPTMWHEVTGGPAKKLEQCWFPGVHSNIGGQAEYPAEDTDRGEIGANTFAWMVDNVSGMLTFEDDAINEIIKDHQRALEGNGIANGWGCGKIVDNFAGLQGKFFQVLGSTIRTPGRYVQDAGSGTPGATNEYIHPMARIRKARLGNGWSPPALAGYVQQNTGQGWQWSKNGVPAVPEYIMSAEKTMMVSYEVGGELRLGSRKPLSRILCPAELLS